jgi:signal transduction histidine kinase
MLVGKMRLGAAFAIAAAFLAYVCVIGELNRRRLADAAEELSQSQARRALIGDLQRLLSDAESGHRGYLLTGDDRYLEPVRYASARVNEVADELVTAYDGEEPKIMQSARRLRFVAGEKIGELKASVALFRSEGADAAHDLAGTDAGEQTMAQFRNLSRAILDFEVAHGQTALDDWRGQLRFVGWINAGSTLLSALLLATVALFVTRENRRGNQYARQLEQDREAFARQAADRAAELQRAYGYLETAQEEERHRLSRELHDELGGLLLAARMDVVWLQRHPDTPADASRERLERVLKLLDDGIGLKRRVVEELRPTLLDNMGLMAALHWQLEETCRRSNLEHVEDLPDDEDLRLQPDAAILLFRIVQEALANTVKHARASRVELALNIADNRVLLIVRDNGVGMPSARDGGATGHGLAALRHRTFMLGGQLTVAESPGGGTEIRVLVPKANVVVPTASGSDERTRDSSRRGTSLSGGPEIPDAAT